MENQLLETVQSVSSYFANRLASGIPVSEEIKKQLSILLNQASELIIKKQQNQEEPPTIIPQTPLTPMEFPSSNINSFNYDPNSETLKVKFQDKYPATNGPVYQYSGVPSYIVDVFKRGAVGPKTSGKNAWHEWKKGVTPSHGAAMAALIKQGGFPYQKIG